MKKVLKKTAALAMTVIMSIGAVNAMAEEKASKFFTDVNENSYGWAIDYVDYIASRGIANGVGDNKFAPGNTIERGDFVIFVSKVFNLKDADDFIFSFKDVPSDSYYCDAIANAKGAGIISEEGMFYPEEYIKRIDAMTMLYRALSAGNYIGLYGTTNISMYSDASAITSIEQQAAVGTLTTIGIVQGNNGELRPNDTMSRAEMAVVIAKTAQWAETMKGLIEEVADITDNDNKEEEKQKEEQQEEQNKTDESKSYSGEEIGEPIVIQHGGTVDILNSNAEIHEQAAVAISNGSTANIRNSNIYADDASTITISDGKVSVENSDIKSKNGMAINSFKDGEIDINGGKISSTGTSGVIGAKNSAVKLTDTEVSADKNSSTLVLGEDSSVSIENSTLSANSGAGVGTYTGVFSIISDPENREKVTIDVDNSTLDNGKGTMFYIRESDVEINFNGGNTVNCSKLISSPFDIQNIQKKGNSIVLNLKNGQVINDTIIELDSKSSLVLNIGKDCSFTGSVNSDVSSDDVDLFLDVDGFLTLSNDMYVDEFYAGDDYDYRNIETNGWNIYYNIDNSNNDDLRGRTIDLPGGGQLIPN